MHMLETAPSQLPPAGTAGTATLARARTILWWLATGAFAAVMAASGTAFVMVLPPAAQGIQRLGYPAYFPPLLGVAKLLGVAALLAPRPPALRQWARTGFTFLLVAAVVSHVVSGDGVAHAAPAALCLALLAASWALQPRPAAGGTEAAGPAAAAPGRLWRLAPWLARAALLPPVVVFLAVAARNLSDPVAGAAVLGISLSTPQAITATRIGFGALPLAIALFLGACLVSTRRLLTGLALAATVLVVATAVRALGIALDGTAAESVRLLRAELVVLVVLLAGVGIETSRRLRSS